MGEGESFIIEKFIFQRKFIHIVILCASKQIFYTFFINKSRH